MYMRTIDVILEELVLKSRENPKGLEYLWDIVSALRGADVDVNDINSMKTCYAFKLFTTARVRGILGLGNLNLDINVIPLSDEQIMQRNEYLNQLEQKTVWLNDHFNDHFKRAMYSLKQFGYDVPDKELNFYSL